MNRSICWLCTASFLLLAAPRMASADPCGMVPPIYLGQGAPIARIGDQNTYVFFKDGVETFVIHPGFKGKVDEFGMLIPFPAIPELPIPIVRPAVRRNRKSRFPATHRGTR